MDAKISHLSNRNFVKRLYLNACYSAILTGKLTKFGNYNVGRAIVALPGYHISLATCTISLNNEHLNISVSQNSYLTND